MNETERDGLAREVRRRADALCRMIMTPDYPDVDIEIARQSLRDFVEEDFPGRTEMFEGIYERRFERLIEQFRAG